MTPTEFTAALGRLGAAEPHRAAPLLGVTPRCVRRWKAGDREVPQTVVILLQVLQALAA